MNESILIRTVSPVYEELCLFVTKTKGEFINDKHAHYFNLMRSMSLYNWNLVIFKSIPLFYYFGNRIKKMK